MVYIIWHYNTLPYYLFNSFLLASSPFTSHFASYLWGEAKLKTLSQKAWLHLFACPPWPPRNSPCFEIFLNWIEMGAFTWKTCFPLDFSQFRRKQVAVNLQSPAALKGTVSLHSSLSVSSLMRFLVTFLYQINSKTLICTSVDISSISFNYQPLSRQNLGYLTLSSPNSTPPPPSI